MLKRLIRKLTGKARRITRPKDSSQNPISPKVDVNEERIRKAFGNSPDLAVRSVKIGNGGRIPALVAHLDALVDAEMVSSAIMKRVVDKTVDLHDPSEVYKGLRDRYLELTGIQEEYDFDRLLGEIADGKTCIMVNGVPKAIVCQAQGYEQRSISEPTTEATIRGSKEGFVESLPTNLSLLRRKIRNPRLRVEQYTIGAVSRTPVALLYIEGISNTRVTEEARRRLSQIRVDSIQESGQLEELVEDAPLSPFPTLLRTERPDRVTGNLLEGRIAILVDGSPFALVAPATFTMFLTTPEDYFERFYAGTVIRVLRYLAFLLSLTLPALYIAVTTFHQELLPTPLILSIAAQREKIPFPAVVEATLMEVVFEILREAGLRLPKVVGQAVSIIGALVIGEAAMRAGLVSPAMVVVVALTGISSFATPAFSLGIAIRLLRFPLMLFASTLGLFGILAGLSAIAIHVLSLRSFGVPYTEPLIPLVAQEHKDTVLRVPWWAMDKRPRFAGGKDAGRSAPGQIPEAPPPDEKEIKHLEGGR
ncbi:MAG: spore germination protein [Bacillota bacterium]|jgi:spore germination protein KA